MSDYYKEVADTPSAALAVRGPCSPSYLRHTWVCFISEIVRMPPKRRLKADKNQTVLTHFLCSGKTADTEDSSTSRPTSDSGTAAADSCARPTTVSASTCSTSIDTGSASAVSDACTSPSSAATSAAKQKQTQYQASWGELFPWLRHSEEE